jgi:hypothetical protein
VSSSLTQVKRVSLHEPDRVVRGLIDSQRFDLGRRWCALHGVGQGAESEIEQNYLLTLLDVNETLDAQQVRVRIHTLLANEARVVPS